MGYIASNLGDGEAVLAETRLSWWSQWGKVLFGVLLLPMGAAFPPFAVLGLAYLLYAWLRVSTSEIVLTNKRVAAKAGILSRQMVEVRLSRIESVAVQQTMTGRIFGYGDIVIAGAGNVMVPVNCAANPVEFKRACLGAVEGDYSDTNLSGMESPEIEEYEPFGLPEEYRPRKKKVKKAKRAMEQASVPAPEPVSSPEVAPKLASKSAHRFVVPE
jgi:hypothetical protein